jgi:hypothetical protein
MSDGGSDAVVEYVGLENFPDDDNKYSNYTFLIPSITK